MFVDVAKVYVKGGDGGDGIVSFRRELHVPEGGPAGGDGGHGGDVIFQVDEGLRTLMDFRYQRHFKAPRGEKGRSKSQHGASAPHLTVRVPPGTVVLDDNTTELIADLTRHGQQVIIARGGKGGRGNTRFATANNPAPYIAEKGEEGEERWIVLELKVMADVGLVGFPSVGKSTLLSVVSAAQPKIGAYHFTTLTPNLGVVDVEEGRSFVLADLPGLIEGAHEGVGLGHDFLRHVERTKVIAHVIDMAGTEGRNPYDDWVAINAELRLYNEKLAERPQVVVANKMDIPEAAHYLGEFRTQLDQHGLSNIEIYPISAATKQGIKELLYRLAELIEECNAIPVTEQNTLSEERKIFTYEGRNQENEFVIRRENNTFIVEGDAIERLAKRTQFGTFDAMQRFSYILRKMGVDRELRKRGAQDGHYVRIGDYEFEFVEHD
jgi:GTP-binding protein